MKCLHLIDWKLQIPSECQTDWIQILSGLIGVQTVCKGYQQTIQVGNELNFKGLGHSVW